MAYPMSSSRVFVLRARRETIALVATATAVTFALSYVVHSRPTSNGQATLVAADRHAWTGDLAQVSTDASAARQVLTSASLVVPKSQLALPVAAVRPLVRLRGCDGSVCTPKPVRRPIETTRAATSRASRPSLMARLNPLRHLPDMTTISRPLAYAGDTLSNWMRRF